MNDQEFVKSIGEDILRACPDYCKTIFCRDGAFYLDVEPFALRYLQLMMKEHALSLDGSIIGAAVFQPLARVTVYDTGEPTYIFPPNNTVIVDAALWRTRESYGSGRGRYRFTLMHEVSHQLLARLGFAHPEPVMYRTIHEPTLPDERLADQLAAYLLMPDSTLLSMMRLRDYKPYICYENVLPVHEIREIQQMANVLQVSYTALQRRLHSAGLLEYRPIYEYKDPHCGGSFDPIGRRMPFEKRNS